MNLRYLYIYVFIPQKDRRSSTSHCRAPKFKSDSLFLPFVPQRNGAAQRSQQRNLLRRMFFFFAGWFFLLLFFGIDFFFLPNTSAHSGLGDSFYFESCVWFGVDLNILFTLCKDFEHKNSISFNFKAVVSFPFLTANHAVIYSGIFSENWAKDFITGCS